MAEVDDSPENIRRIVERVFCAFLEDRHRGEELTTWMMRLLDAYEWGPTHDLRNS